MVKFIHIHVRKFILATITWLYPPFRRIMPYQTFQYAACGGGNTALNILLYFVCYNFILKKQYLHIGTLVFSSHIGAFIMAFLVTFPIGFYLNMFVVFKGSELRKRIQLFRYFLVVIACILFNYLLLSLFVGKFKWYPTPSMIIATVLITLFSYFSQQHFSFKKSKVFSS